MVGEVNGDRSNFGFGMLSEKPSQYGACPFVVNFSSVRRCRPNTAAAPLPAPIRT